MLGAEPASGVRSAWFGSAGGAKLHRMAVDRSPELMEDMPRDSDLVTAAMLINVRHPS